MAPPSPTPPEQPCYLLKLSAELRNQMWALACLPPRLTDIELGFPSRDRRISQATGFRREQPAITRVCQQIRNGALPLFYANGPFTVFGHGTHIQSRFNDWVKAIGDNVHHIEQITISTTLDEGFSGFRVHVTLSVEGGQVVCKAVPWIHEPTRT
ncbi:uncharacterized protein LTR77_005139 [Saxophila tyrrhenica]|uniref:2EXR domain-containing protein n=1 Tax=Saxophila tyrrhenica TaxID=1690608 RepID=A0AAV9PC12_9PEZI|nr:hypothetical protein LTR77_005139 [Saxophila tyrrhenica]